MAHMMARLALVTSLLFAGLGMVGCEELPGTTGQVLERTGTGETGDLVFSIQRGLSTQATLAEIDRLILTATATGMLPQRLIITREMLLGEASVFTLGNLKAGKVNLVLVAWDGAFKEIGSTKQTVEILNGGQTRVAMGLQLNNTVIYSEAGGLDLELSLLDGRVITQTPKPGSKPAATPSPSPVPGIEDTEVKFVDGAPTVGVISLPRDSRAAFTWSNYGSRKLYAFRRTTEPSLYRFVAAGEVTLSSSGPAYFAFAQEPDPRYVPGYFLSFSATLTRTDLGAIVGKVVFETDPPADTDVKFAGGVPEAGVIQVPRDGRGNFHWSSANSRTMQVFRRTVEPSNYSYVRVGDITLSLATPGHFLFQADDDPRYLPGYYLSYSTTVGRQDAGGIVAKVVFEGTPPPDSQISFATGRPDADAYTLPRDTRVSLPWTGKYARTLYVYRRTPEETNFTYKLAGTVILNANSPANYLFLADVDPLLGPAYYLSFASNLTRNDAAALLATVTLE